MTNAVEVNHMMVYLKMMVGAIPRDCPVIGVGTGTDESLRGVPTTPGRRGNLVYTGAHL
jgi:hypothetical protein